uniref:Ig-like domain-containing protein n=1 Tax=Myotis lucifugus TaxID=59463 RepID=G1PZW1_MYOLU
MEFPAASSRRGLVPWLGFLMAVFLLTLWIPPTTARFEIVMTSALEGQDVILRTQNRPPGVTGFIWYRGFVMNYTNLIAYVSWSSGKYIKGPEYTGRETVKFDGTLTIRNVTVWDLGIYIVVAILHHSKTEIGFGRLNVYRPASVPTLLASNTTVTENEDVVVMTCYTDEISIKWLFNATSLRLKRRMKLSQDDKTLTIDPVRREDAGNYQCKVSNPVSSSESAPVELYVNDRVSMPTLLANNTTVTENEDAVVITCYTDESSTNWLFNAMSVQLRESMKLSQDHRTLTIDPIRREDAGNYQCKDSNPISSTESAPVELDVKDEANVSPLHLG